MNKIDISEYSNYKNFTKFLQKYNKLEYLNGNYLYPKDSFHYIWDHTFDDELNDYFVIREKDGINIRTCYFKEMNKSFYKISEIRENKIEKILHE